MRVRTGGPALAAGSYWIVGQVNNVQVVFRYVTGAPATSYVGWVGFAYGAFPATVSGTWTRFAGTEYLMYGTVLP